MAKHWWFGSLLTSPNGAWSGRLVRPDDPELIDAPALDVVRDWFAGIPEAGGDLLLPGGAAPNWSLGELERRGRLAVLTHHGRSIHLNTALEPGWSFRRDGAALADTGWLLTQPVEPDRSGKRRSPVQLIRLLAEIERDAETRKLELAFRADPELSYQLLRLLNSAAFGLRTKVKGIGHAITLLGRRQLQRWLQLLVYAQPGKTAGAPNPLLQLAAYRGGLLEELARLARLPPDELDSAYMVGIFSLLDRLVPLPLASIVKDLPIAPPIAAALAHGEGMMGQWLALAVASERGELDSAAALLERWGVSPVEWLRAQNTAYAWAYSLGVTGEGLVG